MTDAPLAAASPRSGRLVGLDRRSLWVAILAPAAVVLLDAATIAYVSTQSEFTVWRYIGVRPVGGTVFFVLKSAALAWCVGRYVQTPWLRWTVFIWAVALLDFGFLARFMHGEFQGAMLGLAFAQVTLLAVWAVLGDTAWVWRLPAGLLALSSIVLLMSSGENRWEISYWIIPLLIALSILVVRVWRLSRRGVRLMQADQFAAEIPSTDTRLQFGMGHLLVWSAALAPLLLALRNTAWDNWLVGSIGQGFLADPVRPFFLGGLVGYAALLVLQMSLGKPRRWWFRLCWAALLALVLITLIAWSAIERAGVASWGRNPPTASDHMIYMHGQWQAWCLLTYGTLAGLLLFFRASGYRLRSRQASATADGCSTEIAERPS
ncbi:hypothetical protein [Botrimarina hoheduenensis]|uniref:Uncharacterized protein n=1 Tax=Botrimarina hoheduenensis TaxID=2528000 RepID=A0A5C5WAZ7_9BACT|nr:hypothetical protein [Botrimarina hoheduenensis]TWT47423.1 hypothetical protein Pla111_10370 [Botrimarina hoheduenensis]